MNIRIRERSELCSAIRTRAWESIGVDRYNCNSMVLNVYRAENTEREKGEWRVDRPMDVPLRPSPTLWLHPKFFRRTESTGASSQNCSQSAEPLADQTGKTTAPRNDCTQTAGGRTARSESAPVSRSRCTFQFRSFRQSDVISR